MLRDLINSAYANLFTIISIFYLLITVYDVNGHGRLIDPPSRSSAWRFGFRTPINYNDNELFCGGFNVQWNVNEGKCGVCGDPYNGKRDNETPNGKYAQNLVITRTYEEGNIIDIKVSLTANHKGYFVFKLCPATNPNIEVTQDCLDRFPLNIINSIDPNKYFVPSNRAETFSITAKLPNGLTCNRCVFQWTYIAGNNWGKCEDRKSFKVGCGPQETFRGCADVRLIANDSNTQTVTKSTLNTNNYTQNSYTTNVATTKPYIRPSSKTYGFSTKNYLKTRPSIRPYLKPNNNEIENSKDCRSQGIWKEVPHMDQWCHTNCASGFCPKSHCICI